MNETEKNGNLESKSIKKINKGQKLQFMSNDYYSKT